MEAKGVDGTLEIVGNFLKIKRAGFRAFALQGMRGDKDILISTISSIEIKPASLFTKGYIQFTFFGGQDTTQRALPLLILPRSENSVWFTKKQQPDFERIRDAIQGMLNKR